MLTDSYHRYHGAARQSGLALVFSLIFLLILTMIGISSMRGTTLEEKMAGNLRDRMIAFQSAESALRDGENFVANIVSPSVFNGTNGLFGLADVEPDYTQSATWTNNALSAAAGTVPGTQTPPRYVIKRFGTISGGKSAKNIGNAYKSQVGSNDVAVFRITARGTGKMAGAAGAEPTEVILRTYFGRIF